MARPPATRLQLSGQRLLARRMMHALVRGDVAMHDDPLRVQSLSLAVGGVLATLVVVAGAVVGLVQPQRVPDSAPIVIAHDTGALYVRVGDTLHPVLNLASARLIARQAANPVSASEKSIASAKRGPLMGIPGAPATIGEPLRDQAWTVCDGENTVVGLGDSALEDLDSTRPVLVTPRGEGVATTYLLYDGQRAAVDRRNVAVVRALHLDGVDPIPVSRTLLDVVPEVPAIAAPYIDGAGAPGPPTLGGVTIGAVVSIQRVGTDERYVVLRDGLQLVGEVAADLIGFTYDVHARPASIVAPAEIVTLPISDSLPVNSFPQRARTPVGVADGRTVCARWRAGVSQTRTSSNTVISVGEWPYGDPAAITPLVQADGQGPNVDSVVMPGGVSAYVRSARIVGDDGTTGPRFLLTDAGVVFGVHDDDAAKFVGLKQYPEAAPWPIIAHLPRGPELSVDGASVVRDGLPAPS
ncbi:type VII secretion protein EccB [Mycolicibacterium hodleri]|uniref:Type VII secretion protein EccB n=1 Tax=Mycolicibacterium hodleri TaxID=49897 RepID=A0A502EAL5_9MYCO|nr:type VII secretion protein EccB [Mycolicibacterium hodleri]TPG34394.1 type VII secretion protein EccB [Mycolicibacterium hodleri]